MTAAHIPAPPVTVSPADPLADMKMTPQWVAVRLAPQANGKTAKLPLGRNAAPADAHDPANWQTYEAASALASMLGHGHGVGFVLTDRDPFWCLDLDNCAQPDGTWSPLALELVHSLPGTVAEVSQSGAGLHIWGRGPVPAHAKKNIPLGIELYDRARFIALGTHQTGQMAALCPQIADVAARYFPPRVAAANDGHAHEGPCPEWRGPVNDDDLLARARSKPTDPGRVFSGKPTFSQLFDADDKALARAWPGNSPGGYDASSADLSLAGELAYWTGRDRARMERLLRRSALVRDKWDRADYLPETIERACAAGRPVLQDAPTSASTEPVNVAADLFPSVPLADLLESPPPPQQWAWADLIPAGEVTLFASAGGLGKSRLSLALAVSVATGRPFLGRDVTPGRVVVVSAEDGPDVVRRRLTSICRALFVNPRDLARTLEVWDGTQSDPALFASARHSERGALTAAGDVLLKRLADVRPVLVVADGASDLYASDEISRRDVRAFLQALARAVRPWMGAVLLLSHVAKTTARAGAKPEDGMSFSGSTAWSNSSRSRLALFPHADLPDVTRLRHEKSNLGAIQRDMLIHWPPGGAPALVENPADADPDATLRTLLALVDAAHSEAQARGETWARLSPSRQSPHAAGAVLFKRPGWPSGLSSRDGHALLESAAASRRLIEAPVITKDRKTVQVWRCANS